MKKKLILSIMILPVFLIMITGCSKLDKNLIEDEINKNLLFGNWKAVEYYNKDFDKLNNGAYSGVNLIGKLISITEDDPDCAGKKQITEIKINLIRLIFNSNDKGKYELNSNYKRSGFDSKCMADQEVNNLSGEQNMTWDLDIFKSKLTLSGLPGDGAPQVYEVVDLTSQKMVLTLNDGKIKVILTK